MKVANATGAQLDWMVAKCEGMSNLDERVTFEGVRWAGDFIQPSKHWSEGGPIIEREKIRISPNLNETWSAQIRHTTTHPLVDHPVLAGWTNKHGPTPLIAAMRCFVASRLSEEVEVPDELA